MKNHNSQNFPMGVAYFMKHFLQNTKGNTKTKNKRQNKTIITQYSGKLPTQQCTAGMA